MSTPRLPLYERLPEIYRLRDAGQSPPGQLEAYLGLIDEVLRAVRDDTEGLYHNQFIETCDDWVVPYIGDLLGTSHLAGDPWTLRADVARTVRLRRRKGTLGAIESLVHALSGWAAHAVELRERLCWNQHLNHLRPDAGGVPIGQRPAVRGLPVRGGTVNLRDPARLSLLDGAFDPFAHVVDVKPPGSGLNLPTLAVYLWRLQDFLVQAVRPLLRGPIVTLAPVAAGDAAFAVRFDLHPLGDPLIVFNRWRFRADDDPPDLARVDEVPGPMPAARLTTDSPAANPDAYVQVLFRGAGRPDHVASPGLTIHMPDTPALRGTPWRFRGANLCAWESALQPPLSAHEIAIDPARGRIVVGVSDLANEAQPVRDGLLASVAYGAAGAIGAHPVPRSALRVPVGAIRIRIDGHTQNPATALRDALADIATRPGPVFIEIADSLTHDLDLAAVPGIGDEGGRRVLRLAHDLVIRAADGERPVIRLARPLAFRVDDVTGPGADAVMATLGVRLEGLHLARAAGFAGDALIERAAVNRLFIDGCTLDPGGALGLDGVRAPSLASMRLDGDHGFALPAEITAFDQIPSVHLRHSICGALRIDSAYLLTLENTIVDAGAGVAVHLAPLAVGPATGDPATAWGPVLTVVRGMTCFGRMRVWSATGEGGLWVHRLEVHDTLAGCLRASRFSGAGDRLPRHQGCVFGEAALLRFVDEAFGRPGYAQLQRDCGRAILEQGPGGDEMGAWGFLLTTHKWKNISIRCREFMPLGVRPVLITVT